MRCASTPTKEATNANIKKQEDVKAETHFTIEGKESASTSTTTTVKKEEFVKANVGCASGGCSSSFK